jgi:hypothetical protein
MIAGKAAYENKLSMPARPGDVMLTPRDSASNFEFRGPFGTPAHAGKSGAVARRGRWFLAQ